jgi:S-layer homology domain
MTKRSRSVLALAASALALALLTLPAAAQLVPFGGRLVDANEVPSQAGSTGTLLSVKADVTPLFGTAQWIVYTMGPCDGFVRTGSGAISQGECWNVEAATTTTAYLGYPVHLPSGASMQWTRAFFYENDVSVKPSMGFYKVDHLTGVATLIQNMDPPGTAGGDTDPSFGPFSDTVDNYTYTYHILVALPKTATATVRLHQLMIYYKLQVSPAPGSATFLDVPVGSTYHRFVEALYQSGITAGCGGGNYCPNTAVTRGQMAVFLSIALGLQYNN